MPLNRFLRYVTFDTQSDDTSQSAPSTSKQIKLLQILEDELIELGLSDVEIKGDNTYLTATLPANRDKEGVPTIGFIAHVDTSPDASGADVKAKIVTYKGEEITLNEELGIYLSAKDFPELDNYYGEEIIVTDGTTLLGADDKAGVAEIMAAIEHLMYHPEIEHGRIKIAFTCDEEVGRGVERFDVQDFNADWAYTMDGGEVGELEYENFNAASAVVSFFGRNVHPGYAKDKMINASRLAIKFVEMLPNREVPEKTEGREGFFHLTKIEGNVEKSTIHYIIREHDKNRFEQRKILMKEMADLLASKYGEGCVRVEIKDQYYNMLEKIEPAMHVVRIAKQAMEECGIRPKIKPIRGGTDGANLSFRGLPCPNIFAGGLNFHSRFEFIPISSMIKAKEVILKICQLTYNL